MLLAELLAASERVAATRSRLAKIDALAQCLRRLEPSEIALGVAYLSGDTRQGALEGIMLDAIAKAAKLPAARVRSAAMRAGGLLAVAAAALTEGEAGLARCALEVFQPVQPMLAQPAEDVADALERLGTAAFEWKLDGARVQAHKSGGEIRVYTRSLNEVTSAVPEIVAALRDCA